MAQMFLLNKVTPNLPSTQTLGGLTAYSFILSS